MINDNNSSNPQVSVVPKDSDEFRVVGLSFAQKGWIYPCLRTDTMTLWNVLSEIEELNTVSLCLQTSVCKNLASKFG